MKHFSGCLFVILILLAGCRPQLTVPEPEAGSLDLATFTAIGDGYTAGREGINLADSIFWSGWSKQAQASSFPALLAAQFQLAERFTFHQPKMRGDGAGQVQIVSVGSAPCPGALPGITLQYQGGYEDWANPSDLVPPRNLGLPNLQLAELALPQPGRLQTAWRLLGAESDDRYLDLIARREPGFFAMWLGLEELSLAAAGGRVRPNLPDKLAFGEQMSAAITQALLREDCHGLVANLPDPTNFPYFKPVSRGIQALACQPTTEPVYITRANGQVATATDTDRLLLPATRLLGQDIGATAPFGRSESTAIPQEWVLDAGERAFYRQRVQDFNAVIDSLVQAVNVQAGRQRLVLVDLAGKFQDLQTGYLEDGLTLTTQYLSGGVFAIDGLYLTPRGNAFVANTFIEAINETSDFGARIPPLSLTDFPAIRYP